MWTLLLCALLSYVLASAWLTHRWSTATPAQHTGPAVHVTLVTAHPDDEAMFFSPALLALHRCYGPRLHLRLICLSAGYLSPAQLARGADRVAELRVSVRALVERWDEVHVGHQLDSHSAQWQPVKVAYELAQLLRDRPVHVLLTFDEQGASQHRHHVTVHRACQLLRAALASPGADPEAEQLRALLDTSAITTQLSRDVSYFKLQSVPLPYKYLAWLTVPLWRALYQGPFSASTRAAQLLLSPAPAATWRAMALHRSQFVWFRVLYLTAASYVYYNVLVPL